LTSSPSYQPIPLADSAGDFDPEIRNVPTAFIFPSYANTKESKAEGGALGVLLPPAVIGSRPKLEQEQDDSEEESEGGELSQNGGFG